MNRHTAKMAELGDIKIGPFNQAAVHLLSRGSGRKDRYLSTAQWVGLTSLRFTNVTMTLRPIEAVRLCWIG